MKKLRSYPNSSHKNKIKQKIFHRFFCTSFLTLSCMLMGNFVFFEDSNTELLIQEAALNKSKHNNLLQQQQQQQQQQQLQQPQETGDESVKSQTSLAPMRLQSNFSSSSSLPLDLPLPLKTMRQYKAWHSNEALQQGHEGRKYTVAYYFCPDRAGNVLHNLYNTLTWAIITNRTVLLQYVDWSRRNNKEADCERILKRQAWIPIWKDWKEKLNLSEPMPISLQPELAEQHKSLTNVIFPQDISVVKVKGISYAGWPYHPMHPRAKNHALYIQEMPLWDQQRVKALYALGVNFLLGMLLRETFTLLPGKIEIAGSAGAGYPRAVLGTTSEGEEAEFSVALHSRHPVTGDDGSFINTEIKCLETLMPPSNQSFSCLVYLLSDREKTIEKLSDWVEEKSCRLVTIQRQADASRKAPADEHGLFTYGFLQELDMAAASRTAVIGDRSRSSSLLLTEVVAYERHMQAWKQGTVEHLAKLKECHLPVRDPRGYNHGPGTPTFIGPTSYFPLLGPSKVLEDYKRIHGHIALQGSKLIKRKHVVGVVRCPLDPRYHEFLDSLAMAIVHNRTLFWRKDSNYGHDCKIQEWLPAWEERAQPLELSDAKVREESTVTDLPSSLSVTNSSNQEPFFEYGESFVRGMLFAHVYEMGPDVEAIFQRTVKNARNEGAEWTIVLDATALPIIQTTTADNCLFQALSNRSTISDQHASCKAVVLADGPLEENSSAARQLIQTVSEMYNCTVFPHVVEPTSTTNDFWEALAVGSQVRHGWVGPKSSHLMSMIRERIQYQRLMEARSVGRFPIVIPEFRECLLGK